MTGKKQKLEDGGPRDRSDIGEVELPIEKIMDFRDVGASGVQIEARLVAGRSLTDMGTKHPR